MTVYTVPEVARILKCGERHVRILIASGKLKAVNTGGARGIRVSSLAIADYMTGDPEVLQKCNNARNPSSTLQHPPAPSTLRRRK